MSLFGILLIIALITAIPTFGLSLVALYFAKKWINSNEGKKIASAAVNAKIDDKIVAILLSVLPGPEVFSILLVHLKRNSNSLSNQLMHTLVTLRWKVMRNMW